MTNTPQPEDLLREPDGVPHDIVWRTTLSACVLAVLALAAVSAAGWAFAVGIVVLALPFVVLVLARRSEQERDHVHPSR